MPHSPYLLLAPGPVNIHPKVREILSAPMIHHRTPLFDEIFKRVRENLKMVFQTRQNCYLLTSTGSGGMECLLANTLSTGDKILVINSGKFGERWAHMARAFHLEVLELVIPWGEAVQPSQIDDLLRTHDTTSKPIAAVFCQATETSTAVAHPIEALGEVIHKYEKTLFLVDGITALGAYPLPMDAWHIDGLVGGSQKAFMLPTGMSFVSFSEKAWKRISTANLPRYYFDIREEERANKNGETWFSSNVALIRALDVVLTMIQESTLQTHFHTIEKRAAFTRFFGKKLGLDIATHHYSNSVTALKMPSSVDGQKIRSQLEKDFQITIMGGQDQWKGKVLRIGHMGYIQDADMIRLFEALQKVFAGISPSSITKEEMEQWLKTH